MALSVPLNLKVPITIVLLNGCLLFLAHICVKRSLIYQIKGREL